MKFASRLRAVRGPLQFGFHLALSVPSLVLDHLYHNLLHDNLVQLSDEEGLRSCASAILMRSNCEYVAR